MEEAGDLLDRYRFEGFDHYEEARSRGKGVLFLTAHLGNWELASTAVAAGPIALASHNAGESTMPSMRQVRLPIFKLAGFMAVTAIALAGAQTPVIAQSTAGDRHIPPKFVVGPIPQSILDVKTDRDFIYDTVKTIAPELDGYDDVLLDEEQGLAYATGRDGWIWKVDLKTEKAEHFVDVPVMAAGIHLLPGEASKVVLSCSRSGF